MKALAQNRNLRPGKSASLFVPFNQVYALHCSASSSRQWERLTASLPPEFFMVPVDLVGHGNATPWEGAGALSLAREVRRLLSGPLPADRKFNLIGHSYGGGVALRLAVDHPARIKSLILIEPSSFHLLRQPGKDLEPNLPEIETLVATFTEMVIQGNYCGAMRHFTDYWNRPGTWEAMAPDRRKVLAAKAITIAHHFSALLADTTKLAAYGAITAPTLILCGTNSPRPSRAITRALAQAIPHSRHRSIAGAGHMSPFTHGDVVNTQIVAHLKQRIRSRDNKTQH